MTPTRRAFTLIETLVVIGVIGVLVGLLMSAVQTARGSAGRAACANNLKQLALAAQMHHNDHGSFPAASGWIDGSQSSTGQGFTTWPMRLLPYLEQQALWDQTVAAHRVSPGNSNRNPPHVGLATVIKTYTCPTDGRLSATITDDRGYTAAYGSYMGVGGGVSRPLGGYDGVMRAFRGVRLAEVIDGASNTLVFGERPPWGRYYSGTWYGTLIDPPELVSDPNWAGGAITAMHVYSDESMTNGCRGPFRFGPGRLDNRCDAAHFWSLHRGGANFALCDGSVRFLSYSAEPVMIPLATRAGGESVTIPD